jgi:hypothetical protein
LSKEEGAGTEFTKGRFSRGIEFRRADLTGVKEMES